MDEQDPGARCPRCGSTEWIPILYGLPVGEATEAAERGEIAISGCLYLSDSPNVECRRCSTRYDQGTDIEDDDELWARIFGD